MRVKELASVPIEAPAAAHFELVGKVASVRCGLARSRRICNR